MRLQTRGWQRAARRLRASGLTLLFSALSMLLLAMSLQLSRAAGAVPRIVLVVTLALLLCELVVEWRGTRSAPPGESGNERPERRRRATAGAAWIGGLLLAIWVLGVTVGSFLFCTTWLRWHAREGWSLSLGVAFGFSFVTWLVFSAALGVELYPGLTGHYLR